MIIGLLKGLCYFQGKVFRGQQRGNCNILFSVPKTFKAFTMLYVNYNKKTLLGDNKSESKGWWNFSPGPEKDITEIFCSNSVTQQVYSFKKY